MNFTIQKICYALPRLIVTLTIAMTDMNCQRHDYVSLFMLEKYFSVWQLFDKMHGL